MLVRIHSVVKNSKSIRCLYHKLGLSLPCFSSESSRNSAVQSQNKLLKYFRNKIEATGPITVAEYMREVLTNPYSGYYMHRDVFGTSGDFITSPEISQMFGELIGVWLYNEWYRLRQPHPVQIVEFGPGRGTLSEDILRVFSKLNTNDKHISLHLVEVSPHLRALQKLKLCDRNSSTVTDENDLKSLNSFENGGLQDKKLITKYGVPVTWHYDLQSVPNNFSLFLAHEFFDALPIHKFRKTPDGWREILVDSGDGDSLQFVISRNPTPASKIFIDPQETRNEIEVSPESGILIDQITMRMKNFGGISLVIDYGYVNHEKTDTFRGFRKHELHDPLLEPGSADLTADVDFSYLIKHLNNNAIAVGPVTQATFLKNMSIDVRLEKLLKNATPDNRKVLKSGHKMLLEKDQMGERYKFLALYPAVLKDFLTACPPAGFS